MNSVKLIPLTALLLMTLGCFAQKPKSVSVPASFPVFKDIYLGEKPPGKVAQLFAPGMASTDLHDDASPAFSSDLKEMYLRVVYKKNDVYRSNIYVSKETSSGWSVPQIDLQYDTGFYGGVHISKDGKRKYVTVNNDESAFNMDIAVSTRTGNSWSPLKVLNNLNSSYNESGLFEYNGYLYWFSEAMRNDPFPKIYKAKLLDNGTYGQREEVTQFPKGALLWLINEEHDYAIMTMKTEFTGYDLFVSFKNKTGIWGEPINMGLNINSTSTDKAASLSPDGKYLFFVSGRRSDKNNPKRLWDNPEFEGEQPIWKADIYWVDASVIEDLRPN